MNKKIWTPEEKNRFREMCLDGASNKELANAFNVTLASVHHKRSAWGLTMEKCAAMKAAAGAKPIDDIPSPVKPIYAERGMPAEENAAEAQEKTITIDAQAFFALAQELSENAEAMEKLKTDNLELKTQLLNQSQLIAKLQEYVEGLQGQTAKHQKYISGIKEEMGPMSAIATFLMEEDTHKCHYMGRSGLYRLFHRYEPLCRCRHKEAAKKEAKNAGNN